MTDNFQQSINRLAGLLASRIYPMCEVDAEEHPERSLEGNLDEYLAWALEECATNDGLAFAFVPESDQHGAD